jgi:hypothetical protein
MPEPVSSGLALPYLLAGMLRNLPNVLTLVFNRLALIAWQPKREAMPKKRTAARARSTLTLPKNCCMIACSHEKMKT